MDAKTERRLKADFRNFLFVVWKYLNLPKPTAVQLAMAWFLQHGPDRLMIQAFRGVGKSWIAAAFVVWCLWCNPQLNILVVSASKNRADNFATFCLQIIETIPWLEHLKPREDQRRSKLMFDVGPAEPDQNASVMSAGITGQITGFRADIIVPDDVEVPKNSETQLQREKLAERVKEFESILKPGGRIAYLGTPQTEQSIYNLLPERGYEIRVWPVMYPDEKQAVNYAGRLAPEITEQMAAEPKLIGHSTEPSRFTDLLISRNQVSLGRATFALQFMLDTRLSDANKYPLRLSDLVVMPLLVDQGPEQVIWAAVPENIANDLPNVGFNGDRLYRAAPIKQVSYSPYTGCVMFIDPAGRGSNETAYAVVAILNGNLFLLDAGGYLDGYSPATLNALAATAKQYKVKAIVVEPNFGDGMFNALLTPVLREVYPVAIEESERANTQKEKRIIDTLEPVLSSHRLAISQTLVQRDFDSVAKYDGENSHRYRLLYQLTRITADKGSLMFDDRVDALAGAVGYWVRQMAVSQDDARKKAEERRLDEDLRRFKRHVFGFREPRGKSVIWKAV